MSDMKMEAQCWVCPYCFDDHAFKAECKPVDLKIHIEGAEEHIEALKAELESMRKEREEYKKRIEEMREQFEDLASSVPFYKTMSIRNLIKSVNEVLNYIETGKYERL